MRSPDLTDRIAKAMEVLNTARAHGDTLQIELAEDGLNDLLDRLGVTLVTRNGGAPDGG